MKDLCLNGLDDLKELVLAENERQLQKWGIQDHNSVVWYTILAEEVGELAQAMLEYHFSCGNKNRQAIVKEAIQSATLCLKIAEMYSHGE